MCPNTMERGMHRFYCFEHIPCQLLTQHKTGKRPPALYPQQTIGTLHYESVKGKMRNFLHRPRTCARRPIKKCGGGFGKSP